MFGRSPRRQSGADRAHGRRAQDAHVQAPDRHGIQGDRGRVSLGLADGLRFRALHHRGRLHSRGRGDPGADPVPPRADRPHLRGGEGGEESHSPLLQFDLRPATRSGFSHRSGRREDNRRRGGEAGEGAGGGRARDGVRLRIFARKLHRHGTRSGARHLRGGEGGDPADSRATPDPQPARHRRNGDAEQLCRRLRMVRAENLGPRQRDPLGSSA